jgi:hypothetical protein
LQGVEAVPVPAQARDGSHANPHHAKMLSAENVLRVAAACSRIEAGGARKVSWDPSARSGGDISTYCLLPFVCLLARQAVVKIAKPVE